MKMKVVEQLRVSPPPGSVADASLPLTFLDVVWAFMDPVHRLFLYPFPHSTAHFVDSLLPNLKSSLSLALRDFYPLAGNFICSDSVIEIRYVDGDSVSLTVVEYDDDDGSDDPNLFEKLCGSDPCDFQKFKQLTPQLSAPANTKTPLLALQVTVFPNNGISLGVTVHHAACDGSSSIHFLKSWASACISVGSPISDELPPPLIDRSLIADPHDKYSYYLNGMREFFTEHPVNGLTLTESRDDVLATFTLNGDHIRCRRELVTSKARIPHCSTFVLAISFVWACLAKIRRLETDRSAVLSFSANCQSRLSPPVPSSYFGNCLCFVSGEVNVGDLIGGDGLVVASEAIGRAIEGLKDGLWENEDNISEKLGSLKPGELLSVAGSPKFGVYGIDFGWGRPRKVAVPSIGKMGAVSLAESRKEGGGVEIGLVLQRQEMDEFTARFSEDLNSVKKDHLTSV